MKFKYKVRIDKYKDYIYKNNIWKEGEYMKIAVIMGSKSDYPKLEEGIKLLEG